MVRLRISIGIIIALLLICGAAVWGVGSATGQLLTTLSQLESAVQTADYESAAEAEARLSDQWEHASAWLRLAVSKTAVQEISGEISRLGPLIESENDELSAELAELRSRLDELKAAEYPSIDRVF